MSRNRLHLRLAILALTAGAFFVFAPAGRPQENTLNYARRQVDTLTEFDLAELGSFASSIIIPAVPRTETGFIHNLKQRRVLCILPGEELHVFEATTRQTLEELTAGNVERVRQRLAQVNSLTGRKEKLGAQIAQRAELLKKMREELRDSAADNPDTSPAELCRTAARSSLAQMKAQRELASVEAEHRRRSLSYFAELMRLSAVLNAAETGADFSLLKRREPVSFNRDLVNRLAAEAESITAERKKLADDISELQLREERLLDDLGESVNEAGSESILASVARTNDGAVDAACTLPGRFAELCEVALALAAARARQGELGALLVEVNALQGDLERHGLHDSIVQQVMVSPREFDTPRLTRTQVTLLSSAERWGFSQWRVFLHSLATSFGTPGGSAVTIPPPEGVFTGPRRIRLSPNEIPALLTAAAQLPPDTYDRIAELLELSATEYAATEAKGSEEATFWRFVNYFLQDKARRGFASGD